MRARLRNIPNHRIEELAGGVAAHIKQESRIYGQNPKGVAVKLISNATGMAVVIADQRNANIQAYFQPISGTEHPSTASFREKVLWWRTAGAYQLKRELQRSRLSEDPTIGVLVPLPASPLVVGAIIYEQPDDPVLGEKAQLFFKTLTHELAQVFRTLSLSRSSRNSIDRTIATVAL